MALVVDYSNWFCHLLVLPQLYSHGWYVEQMYRLFTLGRYCSFASISDYCCLDANSHVHLLERAMVLENYSRYFESIGHYWRFQKEQIKCNYNFNDAVWRLYLSCTKSITGFPLGELLALIQNCFTLQFTLTICSCTTLVLMLSIMDAKSQI